MVSVTSYSVNAWALFSISTTATGVGASTATSTNALLIPVGVPVYRYVLPNTRYSVLSS
jgi:hypothetical protein